MKLSVVIPVYHEDKTILSVIGELEKKVKTPHEIIIVYDDPTDPTKKVVSEYKKKKVKRNIQLLRNNIGSGRGVLNAVKSGFAAARGEAIVVVMADLSDDIKKIDTMYKKITEGYDIVNGSRYMKGGKKIGGPFIKTQLSKLAGFTLYTIARIPTHDVTNAFKMYRKEVLDKIKIESEGGFEYSLEILVKAKKKGYKITEVPTTWLDRTHGTSKFKLFKWLPYYLRWYIYALS